MEPMLRPITSKAVEYSVLEIAGNEETERAYKVTSDDNIPGEVFIYATGGDIRMPVVDVPLLVKALQDYIK